jgi:hypothetical protein
MNSSGKQKDKSLGATFPEQARPRFVANLTGALGFCSRHTDRGLVVDRNEIEQENKSTPNKPAGALCDENETKNQCSKTRQEDELGKGSAAGAENKIGSEQENPEQQTGNQSSHPRTLRSSGT